MEKKYANRKSAQGVQGRTGSNGPKNKKMSSLTEVKKSEGS